MAPFAIASAKRTRNTCELLLLKSRYGVCRALNNEITKLLVVNSSREFSERQVVDTQSPVVFDDPFIFFDDFRRWTPSCWSHGKPHILKCGRLASSPLARGGSLGGVQYMLTYESRGTYTDDGNTSVPFLLLLFSAGYMIKYKLSNGTWTEEQTIYLSTKFSFASMSWHNGYEDVVLKSTYFKDPYGELFEKLYGSANGGPRERAKEHTIFVHIAIFQFRHAKLTFQHLLTINKSIFGDNIRSVMVHEDMLLMTCRGDTVLLFDLKQIIHQCHVPLSAGATRSIGIYPNGLKRNIEIREMPPILLELNNCPMPFSIGGMPHHYMHASREPGLGQTVTAVRSLANDSLSGNIVTSYLENGDGPTSTTFHPGPSILQTCTSMIKRYHFQTTDIVDSYRIVEDYTIRLYNTASQDYELELMRMFNCALSSLRKKEVSPCTHAVIHNTVYDDELKLLVVLWQDKRGDFGGFTVGLYQDDTGKLLRQFPVNGLKNDYEYTINFNRDVFVCVGQSARHGGYSCAFWRLQELRAAR